MRCQCCNRNLNDFESTLKNTEGGFLDTCKKCLKGLGIPVVGRTDLEPDAEAPDGEDFDPLLLNEEDFDESV